MSQRYKNASESDVQEAMINIILSSNSKDETGFIFYSRSALEIIENNMPLVIKIIKEGRLMGSKNNTLSLNVSNYPFFKDPIKLDTFIQALENLKLSRHLSKFSKALEEDKERSEALPIACAQLALMTKER